jgi:ABC-type branched-subunit amino acid transport system substrate-binding protein
MLPSRFGQTVAFGAMLSLTLVACGQKPGVHVAGANLTPNGGAVAAPGQLAPTDGATEFTLDDSLYGGSVDDTGAGIGGTDASEGSTDDASGGTAGESSGASASGSSPAAAGATTGGSSGGSATGTAKPTGVDRTGADADVIEIGIHAPVTGAAPLPATSFETAGPLYWEYVTQTLGQTVLGRKQVEVTFRDDKYDPTAARQVCREMASEAFMGIGGGGTDQIAACGQFAGLSSWPYFSGGATEAGLRDNPWYFATSMSYRQQTGLLAQWVAKNHPGKKTAAIITDTANFDDAISGWETAQKAEGLNYYKTRTHSKGDASWYSSMVGEMQSNNVEVLFILSSPVDYIRFAQKARENGYAPQYIGVGITALNAVLSSGCGNNDIDGGEFLSPLPGLDWARKNLPEFFEAGKKYGRPTDDISLALWGIAETTHQLFNQYGQIYGNDLTREDFRAVVETLSTKDGVFPGLQYSPDNHFGGNAMHMIKADCASEEYKTVATYAKSF